MVLAFRPSTTNARFSLTATHELNENWVLSAVFVYATGNTLTPALDRYIIDGDIYTEFADRNSYRMPAYHRMDLSATYTRNKANKRFNSSWNFSIYNVYNRANPTSFISMLKAMEI